jgi:hypothetical protein
MKYFDKWQKFIVIGAGVSLFMMIVFYVAMVSNAQPVLNDVGEIVDLKVDIRLQLFYSTFFFMQLAFGAWFIARSITYRMRKKEALKEQEEY